MIIQAGDYVRYLGQIYEVLAVHPELGIRIVPGYEYLNPERVEPVETEVKNSGITTGPWRWEFIGTMGNWFLVGNDGRGPLVGYGPNTDDGKLMASAPDLAAEVARLKEELAHKEEYTKIIDKNHDELAEFAKRVGAENKRLKGQVEAMREALKPFADCVEVWEESDRERIIHRSRQNVDGLPDLKITVDDLMTAWAVLGGEK